MPQQIARRDGADDLARCVRDAKMPEPQPIHAADGAINVGPLRHGLQRRLHMRTDGHRERSLAAGIHGAQDIALRHNADFSGGDADEEAAHALFDHQPRCRLHGRVLRSKDGRFAHDVAHQMTVGETIDAQQSVYGLRRLRGGRRPGTGTQHVLIAERAARHLCLGQRPHIATAQQRHQGQEHLGGSDGVAESAMATHDVDAQPRAQAVKTVMGERGRRDPRQQLHVQPPNLRPRPVGQAVFALKDRQIVSDGMADDDRFANESFEWLGDGREPRCIGEEGFGNAMHGHGGLRNAATGIDESFKALRVIQIAAFEAHRANLHETCLAGVQPGCFRVENDGIQSKERR
jgi:hypothetical protein